MKQYYCICLVFFLALMGGTKSILAQNIAINFTGIKSNKGQIVVSVFKDNESFKDEKAFTTFSFWKTTVQNGVLKVGISLQPGVYGLSALDDENSNSKMDKNMLRMPKEGFGFSNFYLSGMSRPTFDDFKFEVKDKPINTTIKLRYM